MSAPITNAKDVPLNANSGTLPDVSGALLNYFQKMTLTKVVKTVVNHQVVETPTPVNFEGVIQPFSQQQLQMKAEGQRDWIWSWLHALPNLTLNPDDVVIHAGIQYRVMKKSNTALYGYVSYEIIQDYQGAGP